VTTPRLHPQRGLALRYGTDQDQSRPIAGQNQAATSKQSKLGLFSPAAHRSHNISPGPLSGGWTKDGDAICAALTTPWSNGQTEVQVNRLKLIKRQMYGHASFDLLRRRVLLAA
jgi:transposase